MRNDSHTTALLLERIRAGDSAGMQGSSGQVKKAGHISRPVPARGIGQASGTLGCKRWARLWQSNQAGVLCCSVNTVGC